MTEVNPANVLEALSGPLMGAKMLNKSKEETIAEYLQNNVRQIANCRDLYPSQFSCSQLSINHLYSI